jgi:RimJ/RimL family protein N-acetyltransferase
MTAAIRVSVDTDADAEGIVALRRAQYPYAVTTPAVLRHHWAHERPAAKALRLVAEDGGEIVAVGRASFNTWTAIEGATSLGLLVARGHRNQGIGTSIYNTLMDHLAGNGATRVEGWGDGDDVVGGFLSKRGFERRHELRYSHLDLREPLPDLPKVADGVRAVPFAETTAEDVFSVDEESIKDEPGDTPADAVAFDEWYDEVWINPAVDHQASTLVYADGKPAAYTIVEVDFETRRMWSGGTGSLRAVRGRGLAKIAKSVALRKAAQLGVEDAYTTNDEVNAPMLAINVWLGYKPCDAQWSYFKAM